MMGKRSLWSCIVAFLMVWSVALGKKEEPVPHQSGLGLAKPPITLQSQKNPYAGQTEAVLAGEKLFKQHCATCHGMEGRGKEKAADLHLPLIQKTSAGTLFWFLRNGNSKQGMPSWSSLPDQQLWQVVTFLETLH
jgi:mono/diheme cytochrome c family protein